MQGRAETLPAPGFLDALIAAIAAGFVLSYAVPADLLIGWLLGGKDAMDYLSYGERLKFRLVLQYGATSAIAFPFLRRLPLSRLHAWVLLLCNGLLAASVGLRYWLATQDAAVLRKTFAGGDAGWATALSTGALALLELAPATIIFVVLVVAGGRWARAPKPAATAAGAGWLVPMQIGIVAAAGIALVAYWTIQLHRGDHVPIGDSPAAKGRAKASTFEALCATTKIDIRRKASDAKGVVFMRPLGASVGLLRRLQFVEVELDRPRLGMPYLEYSRLANTPVFIDNQFTGGDGPVPESRAEYEVSSTPIEAATRPEYNFFG